MYEPEHMPIFSVRKIVFNVIKKTAGNNVSRFFVVMIFFPKFVAVNYLSMNTQPITICTIKNVVNLLGISTSTASRKIELARYALNKPKPTILTMSDFCDYYKI